MHASALANGELFFKTYLGADGAGRSVVEIGSQDVNGSLRSVCPAGVEYIGVDFTAGKGVDIVLDDPYELPFDDASVDCCVSSSVFEHSEMFWLLFLEVLRVLRPEGLFYLNAPSNGLFHRYPVDCWRFYPDSGRALVKWARRSGLNAELLESFVAAQRNSETWSDFVAVFVKDASHVGRHPNRMLATKKDFYNGLLHGSDEFLNPRDLTQEMLRLEAILGIASGRIQVK
jgi:SAM-dependent methyltransferase